MKIAPSGTQRSSPVSKTGRTSKSGGDGFATHLPPAAASETQSAAPVRAAAGLDALLAAQEVGDALDAPQRARQRAADILDGLDDLRHGLLMGRLSRRQIENLARLVRLKREQVDDPKLVEILDQVELRAEVELAKYSTLD